MASNSKNLAELLNSDVTLTATDIANGAVTTDKLADGAITPVKTAGLASAGKNLIQNGAMRVCQRDTTFASLTSGYATTIDRFARYIHLAGTWTITRSADVPTGQGFAHSIKLDCTTARGSLDASSELVILQRIEGRDLQRLKKGTANAEKLTVSFWVKSAKTGTYILELFDHTNSRTINKSYTISASNTWEKKTVTFDADTTGALANTSAVALQLNFWLAQGSNWQSGTLQTTWGGNVTANRGVGQVNLADNTANDYYLTGVQMEVGETATEFEHRPFVEELIHCKRYFQTVRQGIAGMCSNTSGGCNWWYELPVQMRATPSVSCRTTSYRYGDMIAIGVTMTSINVSAGGYRSEKTAMWSVSGSNTGTPVQYRTQLLEPQTAAHGNFDFSAEL